MARDLLPLSGEPLVAYYQQILLNGARVAMSTPPPTPDPPPPTSLARNIIKVAFADTPVQVLSDPTQITIYRGDATAGDIEFDLPRATGSGVVVGFKKTDGSANKLIPTAASGDLISDLPTYEIATSKSVVWLNDADAGVWDIENVAPLA